MVERSSGLDRGPIVCGALHAPSPGSMGDAHDSLAEQSERVNWTAGEGGSVL